jgi:hypothetical protein
VNNFCFNALSLACALREKVVNMDVVKEVMSDLDISRLMSGIEAEEILPDVPAIEPQPVRGPLPPLNQMPQNLSPAEAKAYMQQLALRLRNWQVAVDKTTPSSPGKPGGNGTDRQKS